MSTLDNFGVPHSKNKNKGLVMPLTSYQFRIVDCPFSITQQTMNVSFDMVKGEVEVMVRSGVEPGLMEDAFRFGKNRHFTVQPLNGGNTKPIFGILVSVNELLEHTFRFDYADNGIVVHKFRFKAAISMVEYEYVDPAELTKPSSDPRFPTPQEAIEQLKKPTEDATKDENFRQDDGC